MTSRHLPAHAHRVMVFLTLLMFVAMTPRLIADECHDFSSQGWFVNNICASRFENGVYVGSFCQPNQYIDPAAEHQTMCLPGSESGTCTGSNCHQDSWCTNDGFCNDDFDCCGLNTCDLDRHRCHEAEDNQW